MTSPFALGPRSALALLLCTCSMGCISVGQPFPTRDVASIAIGKATQTDIQRIYGTPFRTGLQDGDVTWTYVNYKLRLFGQQCTQDLVVRFSRDSTVKSVAYNTSSNDGC